MQSPKKQPTKVALVGRQNVTYVSRGGGNGPTGIARGLSHKGSAPHGVISIRGGKKALVGHPTNTKH